MFSIRIWSSTMIESSLMHILGAEAFAAQPRVFELREHGIACECQSAAGSSLQNRARLRPGNGLAAAGSSSDTRVVGRSRWETGAPMRRPRRRCGLGGYGGLAALGRNEDQWDVGHLVVEARAMAELVVLAEVLAVIGGDHDPGVGESAAASRGRQGTGRARRPGRARSRRRGRPGGRRRPATACWRWGFSAIGASSRSRSARQPHSGDGQVWFGDRSGREQPPGVLEREIGAVHVHQVDEQEKRPLGGSPGCAFVLAADHLRASARRPW